MWQKALEEKGWVDSSWKVIDLPGDAGNRSYKRLKNPQNEDSSILMLMAEDAFKSEEASASGHQKSKELDFVTIGMDWRAKGIPVPEIRGVAEDSSFVLLEDFGDQTLYLERQKSDAMSYYKKAIEELIKIQALKPNPVIQNRRFSRELLGWELHHFKEYALEKRNLNLPNKTQKQLEDLFERILNLLEKAESIVCHRDYHSKNLMICKNTRIGILDFQDALMGPWSYDLASLLRDSYVKLSETEEKDLLQYYSDRSDSFDLEIYELTSLQRNLKAIGRFFYIWLVKNKKTHLPFVNPSLERVEKTLQNLSLGSLGKTLKEVCWHEEA